jgi:hypothetical protein
MTRSIVPYIASVAAVLFVCGTDFSAEAKTRYSVEYLFEESAPHPDAYYFDERYDDESGEGVLLYDATPRRRIVEIPDDSRFDEDYYLPELRVPRERKAAQQPKRNIVPLRPETAKSKPRLNAPTEPKLETAKLTPSEKIEPTKQKTKQISCEKGADIVKGYGFADVKPKSCDGKTFAFTGTRSGKSYEINIAPANGELTEVKRI